MHTLKYRWKHQGTLAQKRAWNQVARILRGGADPVVLDILYRSDTDSSCHHPFFGPTVSSIAPYVDRFYRRVVKVNGTPFQLFDLNHEFLSMLAMDDNYKRFFASDEVEDEGVFIRNENAEWERMSENSQLDCEFFDRLFHDYADMLAKYDGVCTSGKSDDECVLRSDVETTYSLVRQVSNAKPPVKKKQRRFAPSGSLRRQLWD